MSAKPIYESKAKELLYKHLKMPGVRRSPSVLINSEANWKEIEENYTWLHSQKLIVKPDQLIKRRGKLGLIKVNADLAEVKQWIAERIGKEIAVESTQGILKRFLIEQHVEHEQEDEYYVCIYSHRDGDTIMFHHEGGVNVGDVDSKAYTVNLSIDEKPTEQALLALLTGVPEARKRMLVQFITELYNVYVDLHFTYLEINPLVANDLHLFVLDVAARLDQCADYLCAAKWGEIEWPAPFGREMLPEEAYIAQLDAGGASLKFTVINKAGRIWTMVAGGGASVIYADTICDLGYAHELANYGEYSGAPNEQQTYEYAQTVLSVMTQVKCPEGKVLLIGGGIANFTNIAATFKGITRALQNFKLKLIEHKVSIFVRRAGPNQQEGLRMMRECGETLGVPMHVFGAETHMTAIVAMALGKREIPSVLPRLPSTTANFLLGEIQPTSNSRRSTLVSSAATSNVPPEPTNSTDQSQSPIRRQLFDANSQVVIWGMQTRAAQLMFDFDFVCRRKDPSLVAMTYPFVDDHRQKFYWGQKEVMLPVYKSMEDCLKKHSQASVLISFASHRSAYDITMEVLNKFPEIRVIVMIAEGIPENLTRRINKLAHDKAVSVIGPATVGAIKPGCLKIANAGGMMDNVLAAKLYRPGSVAYVTRSGGMANEFNNILAMQTDGVFEGIAIGGDRYPATTFIDHVMRYQEEEQVKMIVVLGEVGGVEEYRLVEARQAGKLTKPIIIWCTGTCAPQLKSDVQFGHAGAFAAAERETAQAKNAALRAAGFYVPDSFDSLGELIGEVYTTLVCDGVIVPRPELPPPTVPMDFDWARELGLIRKPASFLTSICDERGQEVAYAGIPISQVIEENMGIGGVLSLLWFQRRLPAYACKYLELCLIVTADHGPAVSGAHNTIVCARAGKDVVSCLTSGLLTIGDRFGGALDGAARQFTNAFDKKQSPAEFVTDMRKKGELIMGIGHRVKSVYNPDKRVEILKKYALDHFPRTPLLAYALEVEKITVQKRANLILNVDGIVGVTMVDLFRECGSFSVEECKEYIEIGVLNALFVLGRSIGFIGHFLDQRRLKQGLYRHPWDDIAYVMPEMSGGGK